MVVLVLMANNVTFIKVGELIKIFLMVIRFTIHFGNNSSLDFRSKLLYYKIFTQIWNSKYYFCKNKPALETKL